MRLVGDCCPSFQLRSLHLILSNVRACVRTELGSMWFVGGCCPLAFLSSLKSTLSKAEDLASAGDQTRPSRWTGWPGRCLSRIHRNGQTQIDSRPSNVFERHDFGVVTARPRGSNNNERRTLQRNLMQSGDGKKIGDFDSVAISMTLISYRSLSLSILW